MFRTDDYDYELPDDAIAQTPIEPRHDARLLRVADLSDHRVSDLATLLRPGDLVVVNRTRVRSARLLGHKRETGGAVEVLLLNDHGDGQWAGLVRPARRLRKGTVIDVGNRLQVTLLADPEDGRARLRLVAKDAATVEEAIADVGTLPLPPYIRTELADPDRYQTIFAAAVGSAAAPTAGLHFTSEVVAGLQSAGIGLAEVELRVGLDTFRPITVDDIEHHEIHSEWCRVPPETAEAIDTTRAHGGRIVAVGTTVVRTLESLAAEDGSVRAGEMATDLYITPGYRFRVVDVLLTNFHVPRSSLLVLVAAFAGEGWRPAYAAAVERGYRFLSFGDAMLLERAT